MRIFSLLLFPVTALALLSPAGSATTILVPDDYTTIQSAINGAINGDEILVKPGLYQENIDFQGKQIKVKAAELTKATVIDGGGIGSVVTFQNGETLDAVLAGFTIVNGSSTQGGGIYCHAASPRIVNNYVLENFALEDGGGIYCFDSTASINNNVIMKNRAEGDSGGGLHIEAGAPRVLNNVIRKNAASISGGLHLQSTTALLANNVIAHNHSLRGGGIGCYKADPVITNNTIEGNDASGVGGGIFVSESAPRVINSVVWNNVSSDGLQIYVASGLPEFSNSNIEGGWSGPGRGNIDADPRFIEPEAGDFHIPHDSPCKDTGDNLAEGLRDSDVEGDPRVSGGTVDIGADEYYPRLYNVGELKTPGTWVTLRVIGQPGAGVTLAEASGLRNNPYPTPYGDFMLKLPMKRYFLKAIPQEGANIVNFQIPLDWIPDEKRYFQAFIGVVQTLTNPMVVTAD